MCSSDLLFQTDDGNQRGVLDQGEHVIAEGRKSQPPHRRNAHINECLQVRETESPGRLDLSWIDTKERAPKSFRRVGADDQCDS